VINVINCLNIDKSDIEYFSDGDIASIKQYFFDLDLLRDVGLFKIPQFSRTEIYATDTFRELVLNSDLTGLDFQNIFSTLTNT
jgi:hypothetical protein